MKNDLFRNVLKVLRKNKMLKGTVALFIMKQIFINFRDIFIYNFRCFQHSIKKLLILAIVFYPYISLARTKNHVYDDKFTQNKIYIIEEIKVQCNKKVNSDIFISLSNLTKGQQISFPSPKIGQAIKNIWNSNIVQNVTISAKIMDNNKISILVDIEIGEILADYNFKGLSEKEENTVIEKSKLLRGCAVSPYLLKNIKNNIQKLLEKGGYMYPSIEIKTSPAGTTKMTGATKTLKNGVYIDKTNVVLDIEVKKNNAQKVHKIYIRGNQDFDIDVIKTKMISTKEIRRPSLLKKIVKTIFSRAFMTYKKPQDRLVRFSYLKDTFFGIYANIFGSSFKKLSFEMDLERIKRELYFTKGYIDAEIVNTKVKKYDDQTIDLFIEIKEGDRYVLNSIKWVGNSIFSDKDLTNILDIGKNKYFDKHNFEKNLIYDPQNSIRVLYQNMGYLFSDISYKITKIDGNTVDIIINIKEEEEAIINKVNISGIVISKDRTIRKYLHTVPTHKYRYIDIERSKNELARANLIEADKIQVLPMPNKKDGTVDLEYVVLKEKMDVTFSAKLTTESAGLAGNISGQLNNLSMGRLFLWEPPIGGGQMGQISLVMTSRNTKLALSLRDPWVALWGPYPIEMDTSLWHLWENEATKTVFPEHNPDCLATTQGGPKYPLIKRGYDGFIRVKGFSFSIGKRLSWINDVTVTTGISWNHRDYKNYHILPKDRDHEIKRTGTSIDTSFSLGIRKDNTNNIFFPSKGYKVNFSVAFTPPYSLFKKYDPTDISCKYTEYHRWTLKAAKFYKIFGQFVIAGTFECGILGGYSKKYGVGPYHRYHLGGEGIIGDYNSVLSQEAIPLRGFINGFHVPKESKNKVGGVLYDKASIELRYLLDFIKVFHIYALLFTEGGNAWAEYNKFNIKQALGFSSFGFGFRAIIPIMGSIGINFGFTLDSKTKGLSSEVHFSAGVV